MNQGIITQTVKYGVKSTKNRGSGDGLTLSAPAAVKITACHFCGFQLYFLCFGRWAPRNRSLEPCQDGNVAALRGSFYVTWIHLAPKFFYYKSKKRSFRYESSQSKTTYPPAAFDAARHGAADGYPPAARCGADPGATPKLRCRASRPGMLPGNTVRQEYKNAGGRSSGAMDHGPAEDDRLRFVFVLFYAARRFTSSTRSRSR